MIIQITIDTKMDNTVSGIIDLKSKIEEATKTSVEEKHRLKQDIKFVKDQQENARRSISAKALEKMKVEIELVRLDQEIEMLKDYCRVRQKQQNDFLESINDQVKMTDFEGAMMNLRMSIENAVLFYREDNLHMELLKRQDITRQLRIAYTEAETEQRERMRRLEEEQRRAEEERRKAEEEQRRAEEAKRLAEEEEIREEEKRFKGLVDEPPVKMNLPEPDRLKSPVSGRTSVDTLSTFTQLLKWQ